MTIADTAMDFFDACETGKGWEGCKQFCHPGATFSAQAESLADTTTLEGYTDWMKGFLVPCPNGRYELKAFSSDEARGIVSAFAVFHATHTVDGPVPATGKSVSAEYVYLMEFDGPKISHMTKVWNDVHSMRQIGWA